MKATGIPITSSQFNIKCPSCKTLHNFFIKGYGEVVLNPDKDEFDTFQVTEDGVSIGLLYPQFVCHNSACKLMTNIVIENWKDL